MKIDYTVTTQTGMRPSNQDTTGCRLEAKSACFFVCDGVAGTPGGDVAASIARDTLLAELEQRPILRPQDTPDLVQHTERAIFAAQQNNPNYRQMSTTLAALFIDRHALSAWWVHVGDSRVYHFRRGALHTVTRDHSLSQQLQDAGYDNSGINSNLLYNALGAGVSHPHEYSPAIALEDGDAFLICTDGFWSHLSGDEMAQALRMVNSPQEWLTLMQKTIDHGQKTDNLSAVAVWIGSPQETTLLFSMAESARFLPPRD